MEKYTKRKYFTIEITPNDPKRLKGFSTSIRKSCKKLKNSKAASFVKLCISKLDVFKTSSKKTITTSASITNVPTRRPLKNSIFTLNDYTRNISNSDCQHLHGDIKHQLIEECRKSDLEIILSSYENAKTVDECTCPCYHHFTDAVYEKYVTNRQQIYYSQDYQVYPVNIELKLESPDYTGEKQQITVHNVPTNSERFASRPHFPSRPSVVLVNKNIKVCERNRLTESRRRRMDSLRSSGQLGNIPEDATLSRSSVQKEKKKRRPSRTEAVKITPRRSCNLQESFLTYVEIKSSKKMLVSEAKGDGERRVLDFSTGSFVLDIKSEVYDEPTKDTNRPSSVSNVPSASTKNVLRAESCDGFRRLTENVLVRGYTESIIDESLSDNSSRSNSAVTNRDNTSQYESHGTKTISVNTSVRKMNERIETMEKQISAHLITDNNNGLNLKMNRDLETVVQLLFSSLTNKLSIEEVIDNLQKEVDGKVGGTTPEEKKDLCDLHEEFAETASKKNKVLPDIHEESTEGIGIASTEMKTVLLDLHEEFAERTDGTASKGKKVLADFHAASDRCDKTVNTSKMSITGDVTDKGTITELTVSSVEILTKVHEPLSRTPSFQSIQNEEPQTTKKVETQKSPDECKGNDLSKETEENLPKFNQLNDECKVEKETILEQGDVPTKEITKTNLVIARIKPANLKILNTHLIDRTIGDRKSLRTIKDGNSSKPAISKLLSHKKEIPTSSCSISSSTTKKPLRNPHRERFPQFIGCSIYDPNKCYADTTKQTPLKMPNDRVVLRRQQSRKKIEPRTLHTQSVASARRETDSIRKRTLSKRSQSDSTNVIDRANVNLAPNAGQTEEYQLSNYNTLRSNGRLLGQLFEEPSVSNVNDEQFFSKSFCSLDATKRDCLRNLPLHILHMLPTDFARPPPAAKEKIIELIEEETMTDLVVAQKEILTDRIDSCNSWTQTYQKFERTKRFVKTLPLMVNIERNAMLDCCGRRNLNGRSMKREVRLSDKVGASFSEKDKKRRNSRRIQQLKNESNCCSLTYDASFRKKDNRTASPKSPDRRRKPHSTRRTSQSPPQHDTAGCSKAIEGTTERHRRMQQQTSKIPVLNQTNASNASTSKAFFNIDNESVDIRPRTSHVELSRKSNSLNIIQPATTDVRTKSLTENNRLVGTRIKDGIVRELFKNRFVHNNIGKRARPSPRLCAIREEERDDESIVVENDERMIRLGTGANAADLVGQSSLVNCNGLAMETSKFRDNRQMTFARSVPRSNRNNTAPLSIRRRRMNGGRLVNIQALLQMKRASVNIKTRSDSYYLLMAQDYEQKDFHDSDSSRIIIKYSSKAPINQNERLQTTKSISHRLLMVTIAKLSPTYLLFATQPFAFKSAIPHLKNNKILFGTQDVNLNTLRIFNVYFFNGHVHQPSEQKQRPIEAQKLTSKLRPISSDTNDLIVSNKSDFPNEMPSSSRQTEILPVFKSIEAFDTKREPETTATPILENSADSSVVEEVPNVTIEEESPKLRSLIDLPPLYVKKPLPDFGLVQLPYKYVITLNEREGQELESIGSIQISPVVDELKLLLKYAPTILSRIETLFCNCLENVLPICLSIENDLTENVIDIVHSDRTINSVNNREQPVNCLKELLPRERWYLDHSDFGLFVRIIIEEAQARIRKMQLDAQRSSIIEYDNLNSNCNRSKHLEIPDLEACDCKKMIVRKRRIDFRRLLPSLNEWRSKMMEHLSITEFLSNRIAKYCKYNEARSIVSLNRNCFCHGYKNITDNSCSCDTSMANSESFDMAPPPTPENYDFTSTETILADGQRLYEALSLISSLLEQNSNGEATDTLSTKGSSASNEDAKLNVLFENNCLHQYHLMIAVPIAFVFNTPTMKMLVINRLPPVYDLVRNMLRRNCSAVIETHENAVTAPNALPLSSSSSSTTTGSFNRKTSSRRDDRGKETRRKKCEKKRCDRRRKDQRKRNRGKRDGEDKRANGDRECKPTVCLYVPSDEEEIEEQHRRRETADDDVWLRTSKIYGDMPCRGKKKSQRIYITKDVNRILIDGKETAHVTSVRELYRNDASGVADESGSNAGLVTRNVFTTNYMTYVPCLCDTTESKSLEEALCARPGTSSNDVEIVPCERRTCKDAFCSTAPKVTKSEAVQESRTCNCAEECTRADDTCKRCMKSTCPKNACECVGTCPNPYKPTDDTRCDSTCTYWRCSQRRTSRAHKKKKEQVDNENDTDYSTEYSTNSKNKLPCVKSAKKSDIEMEHCSLTSPPQKRGDLVKSKMLANYRTEDDDASKIYKLVININSPTQPKITKEDDKNSIQIQFKQSLSGEIADDRSKALAKRKSGASAYDNFNSTTTTNQIHTLPLMSSQTIGHQYVPVDKRGTANNRSKSTRDDGSSYNYLRAKQINDTIQNRRLLQKRMENAQRHPPPDIPEQLLSRCQSVKKELRTLVTESTQYVLSDTEDKTIVKNEAETIYKPLAIEYTPRPKTQEETKRDPSLFNQYFAIDSEPRASQLKSHGATPLERKTSFTVVPRMESSAPFGFADSRYDVPIDPNYNSFRKLLNDTPYADRQSTPLKDGNAKSAAAQRPHDIFPNRPRDPPTVTYPTQDVSTPRRLLDFDESTTFHDAIDDRCSPSSRDPSCRIDASSSLPKESSRYQSASSNATDRAIQFRVPDERDASQYYTPFDSTRHFNTKSNSADILTLSPQHDLPPPFEHPPPFSSVKMPASTLAPTSSSCCQTPKIPSCCQSTSYAEIVNDSRSLPACCRSTSTYELRPPDYQVTPYEPVFVKETQKSELALAMTAAASALERKLSRQIDAMRCKCEKTQQTSSTRLRAVRCCVPTSKPRLTAAQSESVSTDVDYVQQARNNTVKCWKNTCYAPSTTEMSVLGAQPTGVSSRGSCEYIVVDMPNAKELSEYSILLDVQEYLKYYKKQAIKCGKSTAKCCKRKAKDVYNYYYDVRPTEMSPSLVGVKSTEKNNYILKGDRKKVTRMRPDDDTEILVKSDRLKERNLDVLVARGTTNDWPKAGPCTRITSGSSCTRIYGRNNETDDEVRVNKKPFLVRVLCTKRKTDVKVAKLKTSERKCSKGCVKEEEKVLVVKGCEAGCSSNVD